MKRRPSVGASLWSQIELQEKDDDWRSQTPLKDKLQDAISDLSHSVSLMTSDKMTPDVLQSLESVCYIVHGTTRPMQLVYLKDKRKRRRSLLQKVCEAVDSSKPALTVVIVLIMTIPWLLLMRFINSSRGQDERPTAL